MSELEDDLSIDFRNYTLSAGFLTPLRNITFAVRAGESLSIIGQAGSGKTMLLYVISQSIWESAYNAGDLTQKGLCRILGHQVTPRRPSVPILQQLRSQTVIVDDKSAWLPVSISENFALQQIVSGATQLVNYGEMLEALPISAGHRARLAALSELMPEQVEPPILQHLAIIRALLRKPRLLLLDEPFVGMDPVLLKQSEKLILETVDDKTTVVWATNDLHLSGRVSDHTLFMLHGRLQEFTPTAKFYTNPTTREAENFIAGREPD